jgi:hypothetical protein
MKRSSADTRKKRDELATNVRHIADEIRPLTDSIESLTILLQYVWQNREELYELLDGVSDREREQLPPETLFCTCCDAVTTSLAKDLRAGWQCIVDDEGNERGNYAGMCPGCINAEENQGSASTDQTMEKSVVEDTRGQKRLF